MASGKRKYFGTDGVRAVANTGAMTPEFVAQLGKAASVVLGKKTGAGRPRCVIGRDTRLSGDMLEAALISGLTTMGVDVELCGVIPTPAVALITQQMGASFGAMVSASHNPFRDNGIKFVNADGYKLTDEQELAIEALVGEMEKGQLPPRAEPTAIGRVHRVEAPTERYIAHAIATMSGRRLEGWKIALDNANGAASITSVETLRRLGAEVLPFHSSPDGININQDCGCTHPEILAELVKQSGAQVGVAHDGDADRVALCDENGVVLLGDELIAIAAVSMLRKGTLRDSTVVVTTMSNFGLDELVSGLGGKVERTDVGDRYVIAKMRELNTNFGAEESGHIVFRDHATTGDGLIAALQILKIMAETGEPLSELRKSLSPFPQVKRNLRVKAKPPIAELTEACKLLSETETKLGRLGRVLLRYSGTESLIRLLLEGRDEEYLETQANKIAAAIQAQIGETASA